MAAKEKILISVRVGKYPHRDKYVAKVRKAILNSAGNEVVCKLALSTSGEWIEIPEGAQWPDNTKLEATVYEIDTTHYEH